MASFRVCFLPDKSIVANEQNKHVSKVCKEWITYDDYDLHREKLNEDKERRVLKRRSAYMYGRCCLQEKETNQGI
jgi:hypothetical protein